MLREDSSAFEAASPVDANEEASGSIVPVKPFSVYAVSGAEVPDFTIDVDIMVYTGIDTPEEVPGFMIIRENGALVICSDSDTSVEVFNIAGMLVKTLQLAKGRNVIDGLAPGVYIVRGQKVVL